MLYEHELELAMAAAKKAGGFLSLRKDVFMDSAEGKDIKLSSDKKSEKIIIDVLEESEHPILSEECGLIGSGDGLRWIVDPLDGTANYWRGLDELACVSVALWKNDEPVLGVVYRFSLNELYYGIVGEGAWLNGMPIYTSDIQKIKDATLVTGIPIKFDFENGMKRHADNISAFKKIRMLGTAATMGVLVGCGKADAYIEDGIMLWDIAGSAAIVQAAGGSLDIKHEENICACKLFANKRLMEDYLDKIV